MPEFMVKGSNMRARPLGTCFWMIVIFALVATGCGFKSKTKTITRTETRTVTITKTVTPDVDTASCSGADLDVDLAPQAGLPEPVQSTRKQLLSAANSCDWESIEKLAGNHITFSYGADLNYIGYWQELESKGEEPIAILAKLLQLEPTQLTEGPGKTWVWPRAHSTANPTPAMFDELKGVLPDSEIASLKKMDSYFGYRVGIKPNGEWTYFVEGD